MEWMSLDWWRHCPAGQLWGAEARIGLYTASMFLGVDARSRGAGNRVTGAIGALQGLLWYDLRQRVLLLYLEDVWLLSLVLADPKWERGGWCASVSASTVSLQAFIIRSWGDHVNCLCFTKANALLPWPSACLRLETTYSRTKAAEKHMNTQWNSGK